jgi:hypothetical protein
MGRYSIFERSIFSGPAQGKQNSLSIGLNNNLEAKVKQFTDTGVTYKKVVILQNLGVNTAYNFALDSFRMSDINLTARTVLFRYFDITTGALFSPYAINRETGGRSAKYAYEEDRTLAHLQSANLNVNTSIGSNMLEAMKKTRQAPNMTNGAERGATQDLNTSEKLPWNVRLWYSLSLAKPVNRKFQPTQTLNFSGDLMPTKYWTLGISSGYDFTTQNISYTSLNITRDLKCWQAHISWVPFGIRKQYSIAVNLKTSMLSEFKIPRTRQWYDNFQ